MATGKIVKAFRKHNKKYWTQISNKQCLVKCLPCLKVNLFYKHDENQLLFSCYMALWCYTHTTNLGKKKYCSLSHPIWLNSRLVFRFKQRKCLIFFYKTWCPRGKIRQTSLNLILYFPFSCGIRFQHYYTTRNNNNNNTYDYGPIALDLYLDTKQKHTETWCEWILLAHSSISANIYFALTPRHFTFSFPLCHISFSSLFS